MTCYIYLRRSDLVTKNACREGLALFDAVAKLRGKRERIRLEWSPLAYVWLARGGFSRWLFAHGMAPMPNLRGAYLRGADLSGAHLRGADLRGAHLRSANLYGADLRSANLYGADLSSADLRGADLRGAYLSGADLSGADLSGADLSGAYRASDPPVGWRVAAGRLERAP